jgi:hypothetical protein
LTAEESDDAYRNLIETFAPKSDAGQVADMPQPEVGLRGGCAAESLADAHGEES